MSELRRREVLWVYSTIATLTLTGCGASDFPGRSRFERPRSTSNRRDPRGVWRRQSPRLRRAFRRRPGRLPRRRSRCVHERRGRGVSRSGRRHPEHGPPDRTGRDDHLYRLPARDYVRGERSPCRETTAIVVSVYEGEFDDIGHQWTSPCPFWRNTMTSGPQSRSPGDDARN